MSQEWAAAVQIFEQKSKATPDVESTAAQLESLAGEFNSKAKVLQDAALALREAQKKNQELQRRLDAAEANKKAGQSAPLAGAKAKKPAEEFLRALIGGNLEQVKSLLDKGADVNNGAAYGNATPLMSAAYRGYTDIVRLLIDRGAYIEAKDVNGKTALDYAKLYKKWEIVQLLEEAAAAKPKLVVLIDGSGSMGPGRITKSPLEVSLDAILDLSNTGTKVSALLWGHTDLVPVEVTKESFEKVAKGLNSGTEFMPVVEYMKKTAADKPQNFVIVSDGDFFKETGVLFKTLELLSSNPKTTLDFVVINKQKFNTAMEKFAQALKYEFPNQVKLSTSDGANLKALLQNIALRTGHSDKPAWFWSSKAPRPNNGL